MDQRPKIWMHRTFRFWGGLGLLVFLLVAWIWTMSIQSRINYGRGGTITRIGIGSGGLEGGFQQWIPAGLPPGPGEWKLETQRHYGVKLLPVLDWETREFPRFSEKQFTAILPLWVPVLIWVICWPIWMHRGDKKEALLFSEKQAPPDPG